MGKAEDRAYECFPNEDIESKKARFGFLLGYHQAEKDNELTPEDISTIYSLVINAVFELRSENPSFKGKDIYQEVLKRFKAKKGE